MFACHSHSTMLSTDNGVHKVEFLKTHIGHPVDAEELAHVHSLRKKASNNVDRFYFDEEHSNDMIAVESWVMENSESVLFYKRQFEKDSSKRFRDEDFLLVFMKEAQVEKFKEHATELVLIDGTHHDNEDTRFFLHTVMVMDSDGEGYPCCFSITNRSDDIAVEIMFACIRGKVGSILPSVLMSDVQPGYYETWIDVMQSPPDFYFYVIWHVVNAWEDNIRKIVTSKRKKDILRERMRKLLTEREVAIFHQELEKFLQDNDEDLQSFICYFIEYYLPDPERWAFCHRQHVQIDTDISFERFHQVLEYTSGRGYVIQRVRDALHLIDEFLNERVDNSLQGEIFEEEGADNVPNLKIEPYEDLNEDAVKCEYLS